MSIKKLLTDRARISLFEGEACWCGEDRWEALERDAHGDVLCYRCARGREFELHHVHGRRVSNVTVRIDANDHRVLTRHGLGHLNWLGLSEDTLNELKYANRAK